MIMMTMQDERKRSQSLQMNWEGAEEGDTDRLELHQHVHDHDGSDHCDEIVDDHLKLIIIKMKMLIPAQSSLVFVTSTNNNNNR